MVSKHPYLLIFLVLILSGSALFSMAVAQEDVYRIEYTDVFGKLRRPAVDFGHEDHATALEDQGCGACHHAPDEKTGQLVYVEDEEISCSECHGALKEEGTPALREAFHGSCTPCHRQMRKTRIDLKGPTTCGECHKPL